MERLTGSATDPCMARLLDDDVVSRMEAGCTCDPAGECTCGVEEKVSQ